MKKKIIIGSILTVIILMILPSVSAVEFNTAVESNKAQILEQIQSMNIDELREKIKNLDFQELKEKLKTIDYSLIEYAESNKAQILDQIKNIDATIFFPLLGIISFILLFCVSFYTWIWNLNNGTYAPFWYIFIMIIYVVIAMILAPFLIP